MKLEKTKFFVLKMIPFNFFLTKGEESQEVEEIQNEPMAVQGAEAEDDGDEVANEADEGWRMRTLTKQKQMV